MLSFGIELECYLPAGMTRSHIAEKLVDAGLQAVAPTYLTHATSTWWKIVTDGSLHGANGCELVSPILVGEEGLAEARKGCEVAAAAGCIVNKFCGFHVHVGVRHFEGGTVAVVKRVLKTYSKHEPTIDSLVAPSRRRAENAYCRPVSVSDRAERARNLDALRRAYGGSMSEKRYHKVNIESFWRHGTVEFRQHQGTLDPEKVEYWVRFCTKMVESAASPEPPTIRRRRGSTAGQMSILAPNPHAYGSIAWVIFDHYREGMTATEITDAAEHIVALRSRATSRDPRRSVMAYYVNPDIRRGAIRFGDAPAAEAPQQQATSLAMLMAEIGADPDEAAFFECRQQLLARSTP